MLGNPAGLELDGQVEDWPFKKPCQTPVSPFNFHLNPPHPCQTMRQTAAQFLWLLHEFTRNERLLRSKERPGDGSVVCHATAVLA